MTNGQKKADHKLGSRIAIIVATVSFSLYVINMLIGKRKHRLWMGDVSHRRHR